ncbi:hypothetical protein FJ434_23355, partial [Mesorhizobium sp. B2-5-13]
MPIRPSVECPALDGNQNGASISISHGVDQQRCFAVGGNEPMNYQRFFEEAIDQLHAERRYRVFADL